MFLMNPYYLSIFEALKEKLGNKGMKRNTKQLFILSLLWAYSVISFGQTVWPGDINNNGIVNGIDVLYAGIAYGNSGTLRPAGNDTWTAQTLGDFWTQNFLGGINYAYADCDGNGIIDEDDIEVIEENFSLTHGVLIPDEYSNGTPQNDPLVKLMPQNSNIQAGQTAIFDLWLGDEDFPVQDFYGIAIAMNYNPDFTLFDEWEFEEADNAWYDPTDNESEKLLVADESSGKIELAITRINQQSISGAGKVGELSIVIEDIIFGLQADTMNLQIESIRMIDKDFNTLPVVADSTFVIISKTTPTSNIQNKNSIKVFPNPTKDVFTITSKAIITGFELTDITGKKVRVSKSTQYQDKTISVSIKEAKLQPQLYLLKVFTKKGIFIKKVILN